MSGEIAGFEQAVEVLKAEFEKLNMADSETRPSAFTKPSAKSGLKSSEITLWLKALALAHGMIIEDLKRQYEAEIAKLKARISDWRVIGLERPDSASPAEFQQFLEWVESAKKIAPRRALMASLEVELHCGEVGIRGISAPPSPALVSMSITSPSALPPLYMPSVSYIKGPPYPVRVARVFDPAKPPSVQGIAFRNLSLVSQSSAGDFRFG